MSFHNWYVKSIERMHKIYDNEEKEKEAARKLREGMDNWAKSKKIRDEKRHMKREYDEDVDLWGI